MKQVSKLNPLGPRCGTIVAVASVFDLVQSSVDAVLHWMRTHGGAKLAENLAPGASPEILANSEAHLGFSLPLGLRALWSLHDGQLDIEMNPFLEEYHFLSVRDALAPETRDRLSPILTQEQNRPDRWVGTAQELASTAWLMFATGDEGFLAVSASSGRVFRFDTESAYPYVDKVVAVSLERWLEDYSARVVAEDYRLESRGKDGHVLKRRDRAQEQRWAAQEARLARFAQWRRDTPLLEQMREALQLEDSDRCMGVLEDAVSREDLELLDAALGMLFDARPDAKFIAAAVRPVIHVLNLSADQWVDVAVGGALLDNSAIRDIALPHVRGASPARIQRLERTVQETPPGPYRDGVALVLRGVRGA